VRGCESEAELSNCGPEVKKTWRNWHMSSKMKQEIRIMKSKLELIARSAADVAIMSAFKADSTVRKCQTGTAHHPQT
jgi:hypothetical protein